MRVRRFDFNAVRGKPKKTPQGFLRIDSYLTRTGIFKYRRRDGRTVLELRPPDEVLREDSIATLRGAPVTNRHPSEMVSPTNVKALSVGVVNDDVRADGDRVGGSQTVMDAVAIEGVSKGELREVSCGYHCDLDETPGRYDATTGEYGPHVTTGERYDAVQRSIVYNHAALGPRNWGRMGNDVALKLDSIELGDDDGVQVRTDADDQPGAVQPPVDPGKQGKPTMDMITIRIDGVDYEVPKAAAPHIQKALATRDEKLGKLEGERDGVQAKLDQANKDLGEAKKKLDEATDPEAIQAKVDARASLERNAKKVLGDDAKLDGKSDKAIKLEVVKKVDPDAKLDDKSDAYLDGRYDAAVESYDEALDDKRSTRRAFDDVTTSDPKRHDGDDPPRRRKTQDELDAEAWQQPMAHSLDR